MVDTLPSTRPLWQHFTQHITMFSLEDLLQVFARLSSWILHSGLGRGWIVGGGKCHTSVWVHSELWAHDGWVIHFSFARVEWQSKIPSRSLHGNQTHSTPSVGRKTSNEVHPSAYLRTDWIAVYLNCEKINCLNHQISHLTCCTQPMNPPLHGLIILIRKPAKVFVSISLCLYRKNDKNEMKMKWK